MDWNNCLVNGVATLNCVPVVFTLIINAALTFAGVVALFMIIYSGFRFVTSGGDPKGVENAKKTLTWAIIGLILILLSFGIINFLSVLTGVKCLTQIDITGCK
jgi:hypothetical protein